MLVELKRHEEDLVLVGCGSITIPLRRCPPVKWALWFRALNLDTCISGLSRSEDVEHRCSLDVAICSSSFFDRR